MARTPGTQCLDSAEPSSRTGQLAESGRRDPQPTPARFLFALRLGLDSLLPRRKGGGVTLLLKQAPCEGQKEARPGPGQAVSLREVQARCPSASSRPGLWSGSR